MRNLFTTKKATSALVAGLSVIMLNAPAQATAPMPSHVEASLVRVCKALKSNNRLQLIQAVKSSRIKYKTLADGLVCNGKSALDFAMLNGAERTATYLAKRASVDVDAMLAKR